MTAARKVHLPIRGSSLDAAYHCGKAAALAATAPKQQTEYTLPGNAFDAGLEWIAGGSADKVAWERYAYYMTQLSEDERVQIDEEIDQVCKDLQPLHSKKIRLKAQERWALDPDGLACDYDSPRAVTRGRADWIWQEDNGVVHVVDFKRGFGPFLGPEESLQVGAAGLSAMQTRETEKCQLWIGHMPPNGIARFRVTEPKTMEEMEETWQRVRTAVNRDPLEANKGPHCSMCHQRPRCDAYLAPAVDLATRDESISPLWTTEPQTMEKVIRMQETLDAMAKWVDLGKTYVKAFIAANGPLRKGDKEYRITQVAGRQSTSVEGLKRAGLYEQALAAGAIKRAGTTQRLAWCNAKMIDADVTDNEGEGGKTAA